MANFLQKNTPFVLNLLYCIKLILLLCSIIGITGAFFVWALQKVTIFRETHSYCYALLPLIGFLMGKLYQTWGSKVQQGNALIYQEIKDPVDPLPFRMAPMIFIATILTHLAGGSAGREGTAIQLGGSIADQIAKFTKNPFQTRRAILLAGIAGGIAAVFGTPLTGFLFAFEVTKCTSKWYEGLFVLCTALGAWFIAGQTGIEHTEYIISAYDFSFNFLLWICISGIIFGFSAILFINSLKFTQFWAMQLFPDPAIRATVGGVCLLILFQVIAFRSFAGLSTDGIASAFETQSDWFQWVAKTGFTVLTLGTGWKGGEVTPLFYIGSTLGSWLSVWIPVSASFLAGAGLVSVFGAVAQTPIACTVLALELFGIQALPMGIVCLVAAVVAKTGVSH